MIMIVIKHRWELIQLFRVHILVAFIPFLWLVTAQQPMINVDQASNIIHELMGGIVGDTQVVKIGETTYIAALRQAYEYSEQEIILLKSFGKGFIKYGEIPSYLSYVNVNEFLLGDFNEDGFIDIYWQTQSGGNTLNFIEFNIYDSQNDTVYSSILVTNYSPSANITLDEKMPSSFLPFMEIKVTAHPQFLIPTATSEPRELNWRDLYGAFTQREMVAINLKKEFKPLNEDATPLTCSLSASIDHNHWQYISCFKDAVYGVNYEQGIYFVVYVPDTTYDWITELSIYEGLLVIPERYDSSVVTFDPATFELRRHTQ
jgi:hypothetical protein